MSSEQLLGRPLKEVLRNVTAAVAEGQTELDERAMALQEEIDEAIEQGELEYDLDATWFQFSEVDVDAKVAISIEVREERDKRGNVRGYKPVIKALPYNPTLKNTYDYQIEAASEVNATIVPVPPRDKQL